MMRKIKKDALRLKVLRNKIRTKLKKKLNKKNLRIKIMKGYKFYDRISFICLNIHIYLINLI